MGQEHSKYFAGIDSCILVPKHYEAGPIITVYSYKDENF